MQINIRIDGNITNGSYLCNRRNVAYIVETLKPKAK